MPLRQRTSRVASATALVVLVFMVAAALRVYVPGPEAEPRQPSKDSPWALVAVFFLLVASVCVMAFTVVVRFRQRGAGAPPGWDASDGVLGERGPLTWRVALIAFGLMVGLLVLVALLGRVGGDGESPGGTLPADTTPATKSSATGSDPPPVTPPPPADLASPLLPYVYGAGLTLLFVGVVGSLVTARRRDRPGPTTEFDPVDEDEIADELNPEPESLARAAEVGLAEVGDFSREPRKAIIACYAAMERRLSSLPGVAPREFDTASEVLARAVHQNALTPDTATQLVDLFDEARFSPHVMDEGHRDAAVEALTHVLGELRSRE